MNKAKPGRPKKDNWHKRGIELSPVEQKAVAVFRALGQRSRFELWKALGNRCVCQGEEGDYCTLMQKKAGLAQSTISHHLKILQEADLISPQREGTWCCYRLNARVYRALDSFMEALKEGKGGS